MTTSRFTASRRSARKTALAVAAAAGAVLALTGTANAAIFRPLTNADLTAAFIAANGTAEHDTIILPGYVLQPGPNPIVITSPLTVTGDHAFQNLGIGPGIDGNLISTASNLSAFTVNPGVTARFSGFTLTTAGLAPGGAIRNINGTVFIDNMLITANEGNHVVASSGTTTITNSSLTQGAAAGMIVEGAATVDMINSNVTLNTGVGIDNRFGSTLRLRNTVLAYHFADCARTVQAHSGSIETAVQSGALTSCGVGQSNDAAVQLEFENANGGPTITSRLLTQPEVSSDSVLIDAGDPAFCPTVDQRFFVRPARTGCDVGAFELDAAQDTTAPSCPDLGAAARTTVGGIKRMTVPLRDGGSGIGHDGVRGPEETTIVNGTVAFTPFNTPFRNPGGPSPSTAEGMVLTATKTDQGATTRWSFIGRDWAGNRTNCGSSDPLPPGA